MYMRAAVILHRAIMTHKLFYPSHQCEDKLHNSNENNVRTSLALGKEASRVSVFRQAISRVTNRGDTGTRAAETELTVCPWPLSVLSHADRGKDRTG